MPTGNAIDFKWYTYVDDDDREFSVRVDKTWGDDADSGLTAFDAANPIIKAVQGRNHCRYVTLIDPLTGRKKMKVVGTVAAFAAITSAFTQVFKEPGLAGDVTYNYYSKTKERFGRVGTIYNHPEPSTA